jgi:prophage tail gpP-like protein
MRSTSVLSFRVLYFSGAGGLVAKSVTGKPGEYKNSTFAQIAGAIGKQLGINISVVGSPPGADLPFKRVNEHIGETCFQFLERLSRFRNLHVVDDQNGNMIWTRAAAGSGGGGADPLVEGQNIKSARVVIESNYQLSEVKVAGKQTGDDSTWGSACMVSATATNPSFNGIRKMVIAAEQPVDQQSCQMRANHELDINSLALLEAVIEVQGWLTSSGQPWINLVPVAGATDCSIRR